MSNKNIIEEKVRELVGFAVGEASMCWSEIPTSVFDSDKAVDVVDRLTKAIIGLLAHQQARNIEAVERILEDTLAADGFVGFKMDEWRACKVFTKLICARVTAALRSQHLSERQTFEVVEAPGDRCGNTRKLADGTACPGCRACQ